MSTNQWRIGRMGPSQQDIIGIPGVGIIGAKPIAPVLSMDPSWDSAQNNPIFVLSAAWLDQDDLQFEYRIVGSPSWIVSNHTVIINEINGALIDLAFPDLANGDYEARCRYRHEIGGYSDYSNTQTFTIAALQLPVKVFRNSFYSNSSNSVVDFTFDVGAGDCLVVAALGWQGTNGITSLIFDPSGSNISLTQDEYHAPGGSGSSVAIYSGVIPVVSGTKIVRLSLVSAGYFHRGIALWTVSGLQSPLKKQTVKGTNAQSISVGIGDVMFGALYADPSGSTRTYSGSTQAPDALRSSNATNQFTEWAIPTANPTFSVSSGSSSTVHAAVTYR